MINPFRMPTPEEVRHRRREDHDRHEARQDDPEEIRRRQLADAERQYLLHAAQAEMHQAQTEMYAKRIQRLREPQASNVHVVNNFHNHSASR